METRAEKDLVTLPVDVVVRAAKALGRAARFDEARALLNAAQGDPRLAVARAELAVTSGYVTGDGIDIDEALAAARASLEAGSAAETAWDVDFLDVRHDYMRQLFEPGTSLAVLEGRDLARVDALRDRVTQLRDSAPDEGRRGWAAFYLGTVHDNLYGARDEAPGHLEAARVAAVGVGDDYLLFESLRHLGDHAHDDGDPAAREMWEASAAAAARAGGVSQVLAQLVLLAVLARERGEEQAAVLMAGETARWADAIGAERLAGQARGVAAGADPTSPDED